MKSFWALLTNLILLVNTYSGSAIILNPSKELLKYRETNLQCNSVSKLKRTIIKNPTNIDTTRCEYTIKPYSSKVCQVLIEFQRFELQPPLYDAINNIQECGDNLLVGDFTFCGDNTGQHLYLPFNNVPEMLFTFNLPNSWPSSVWHLVVTQLECPAKTKDRTQLFMPALEENYLHNLRTIFTLDNHNDLELLAPHGCHQYFTKPTGNIKTFNFKDDGTTYYPPNMNYVICIKSHGSYIIEYQVQKFSMSNPVPGNMGFDADCRSTIQTAGRREDYLMIPQSYLATGLNILPTFYCGTSLQTYSTLVASAPFLMYFSSDGYTDQTETGFNIKYTMKTLN